MERTLKNREGGILVTKEIMTDKNLTEVTLFPTWGKKKTPLTKHRKRGK